MAEHATREDRASPLLEHPASTPSSAAAMAADPLSIVRRIWTICRTWIMFAVPLAVYAWAAIPLAIRHRENGFGDAVCYVRRAQYLLNGDFHSYISGYWSPLISWCIAPLMYFGMDGLYAGRAVVCFWGAVLVVSFGLLLNTFTSLNRFWKIAAMCAVAIETADASGSYITPDVIVAACLLVYLAIVSRPDLLSSRKNALLAGLAGGFCYLAKAYAFPFVLVHLPLTLFIRGCATWRQRCTTRSFLGRIVLTWIISLAGFSILAAPWIGALTWRYGHLTISTSAARAHAYVGPHKQRRAPYAFGLPPGPTLTIWENPEDIPHAFWSPFESKAFMAHQIHLMQRNLRQEIQVVTDFDRWRASIGTFTLAPLLGLLLICPALLLLMPPGARWQLLWIGLTVVLYCSGYLPVYFGDRYIRYFVFPLLLLLALKLLLETWPWSRGRRTVRILQAVLALSLLASVGTRSFQERRDLLRANPHAILRTVSNELLRLGIRGPFAGNHNLKCYPVALNTGLKYLGFPYDTDPQVVDRRLRDAGAAALVIWSGTEPRSEPPGRREIIDQLVKLPTWKQVYSRAGGVRIYVPTSTSAAPPSPAG